MVQQQSKPDEIVVFSILRDSQCSECGDELLRGDLLKKEADKALCLTCADLAHLVFLPPGNTVLTRRTSKYSTLRAVVLRFSQPRKRYERQGILVEIAALQQAESDCLADAELRDRRREREAIRRNQQDTAYIAEFACHICSRYPACPADQAAVIADHACQKYSGRVGRSANAKEFAPEAIDLAVIAHIRHVLPAMTNCLPAAGSAMPQEKRSRLRCRRFSRTGVTPHRIQRGKKKSIGLPCIKIASDLNWQTMT